MRKYRVALINLGCDKNRIDSEIMLSKIGLNHELVDDPMIAEIIIVNTCGFIEASKQESIDTILEMAQYKEHDCKVLIATGCLTQRYGKEIMDLMPELDAILGVNDYDKILEVITTTFEKEEKVCITNYSDTIINEGERLITTGEHVAYLRIAEGCDNRCAYCAIPNIRGKFRSRTIENIVKEAQSLADQGVKEVILVAQDTTMYGKDLYGDKKLPELLKELSKIEKLEWIRLLYCYAEELTDEIIKEIKENNKVCKYIDIPIQHISDEVLKNMRRKGRRKQIEGNIQKLRKEVPEICIRTTLIVGFPGETEENFEELLEFVENTKFERLGVFKYSREEGTVAFDMEDQIHEEAKDIREEKIMYAQQKISKKVNEKRVGKVYNVIVDEFDGDSYHGRSFEMAPDVDGEFIFTSHKKLQSGDFVKVRVTHGLEYDLLGVVEDELSQ